MVVFTCYHCGDSIQKPKVEKHIKLECKKKFLNARLCCIDCLKDFDVHSYVEHTKCVTEEERYSAKGFVPKPSSNKGERKQNTWIEVMQAVLKKPNLNDPQRNLIKHLSNYPNVPRKQKKFNNFISSSLKHLRVTHVTMDEVFKLIDDEYKASNPAYSNQVQNKESVNSQQPDKSEKVEKSEEVQSDDKISKKKKDKSKLKDDKNIDTPEESTSAAEKENLDESAAFEIVKKKKKKSKKDKVGNESEAMDVDKPDDTVQSTDKTSNKPLESNVDGDVSLKGISKKLKKSNLKELPENCLTDDSQSIIQNDATKIVSIDTSVTESNFNDEISMKGISKKKLKKLKLLQEVQENSPSDVSQTNITLNDSAVVDSNEVSTNDIDLNEDISMKGISKKKLKKLKLLQEVHKNSPRDNSQTNITQNGTTTIDSNEVSTTAASSEKTNSIDEVEPVEENLSKKERKERKKRLKYEAQLKAIETEVVEANELNENLKNETDENQKPTKKKKRKLSENAENEKVAIKKTKVTESVPAAVAAAEEENAELAASKFKWETVIRAVLEKAQGSEISLKKLTKKVVAEYQACHGEETPYDEVLRKFNKKVTKCPFVKILKDRVKLSV